MYCTPDDIAKAVPHQELLRILRDTNSYEEDMSLTIDDIAKLTEICERVSDLCDGYLRPKYALPLTFESKALKAIALTLAVYDVYQLREEYRKDMSESMRDDRNKADLKLQAISKGTFVLEVGVPSTIRPKYRTKKIQRVFDQDTLSQMP